MQPPAVILLATRNPGKLREIRAILSGLPFRIEGLDGVRALPVTAAGPMIHGSRVIPGIPEIPEIPEIEETGETLEENALLKARTVSRLTGLPAISDDSGLEVDFLGGAPGVRSARFAGENATYDDNNRKLLALLAMASGPRRRARFRCVAAFAGAGVEHITEGRCDGVIATGLRGGNGFGYDPLFIPDGRDLTFGEYPPDVKNSISHRSRAFRAMGDYLTALYAGPAT